MDVVFKRNEFLLCDVPVPSGYPQSQTHAGVFKSEDGIVITTSPYPNVARSKLFNIIRVAIRKLSIGLLFNEERSEYFENPCIYLSKDGLHFHLMQSRPLMESPDAYYGFPAYNSDPDLYIENNDIYVLNRSIYRTELTPEEKRDEYQIRIYLIHGILDKGRFKYISTFLFKETTDLIVSPCLTFFKGQYIFTSLWTNCYNDGVSFDGLRYVHSASIESLGNNQDWRHVEVEGGDWIPWHMSLFVYEEKLYSILACVRRGCPHRCYQMLGAFNDSMTKLEIYKNPLTDYNSYRGSAYVDADGIFRLYSTTVNELIKGGHSCDGREIIYAARPFTDVLNMIR